MIYPSKKAWWAYALVPVGFLQIGVGTVLLYVALQGGAPPPVVTISAGILSMAIGALVLWSFFGACSEITPSELIVRFGPLRFCIPLAEIVEVFPTRSLIDLRPGWGLAWSLDRIHIKRRKPNSRIGIVIKISPADKVAFLRELSEAVPDLEVTGDGKLRLRDTQA